MGNESNKAALKRAMTLCSRSEKCISDIMSKLSDWGISDHAEMQKIIQELINEKFIDESRYAKFYALDKHKFNNWGKIKIRMMLISRGISTSNTDMALREIDMETYRSNLLQTMKSKRSTIKAKNQFDIKAKLFRFAQSKGYEADLIYKTLDEIISSEGH